MRKVFELFALGALLGLAFVVGQLSVEPEVILLIMHAPGTAI
jgi:hypothetical protein